jgi:membrane protein DedA with SNARE-associated domain
MFQWVIETVEQAGYPGIVLLMFLENVFPPIPSEVIMSVAGFVAARGALNIWLVIASGTVGSVAGAYFWFLIGLWLGHGRVERLILRFGRVLTMNLDDLEKARIWFRWRAHWAVFLGRLVPTIRTLISVPAGIAPMRTLPFLAWTTLGTALWTTFLAFAGYVLESRFALVEAWINPISKGVVALIVVVYVFRVVTYKAAPARD